MKKKMISLLTLCALCAGVSAQTVTVADVEALPGETVAFSLNMNGGKADAYTSLQFNVTFPAEGFTTTGDYVISSAWKNASATIGDVDASGLAVVPVSSAEPISGSDVDHLLAVNFTVDNSVALGEYDVTLSAITFGYGFTDKDIAPDVTFKVRVVAAHTIVLDENSTSMPESATGVNVRVLRTITAGSWSSICLPFAMTSVQVKEAFGDDVQIADFTGCVPTYDAAEENIIALKINFENVSVMEANHPYIIKVGSNVSQFTVEGIDLIPSDELSVDRDEDKYKRNGKWYYDYNSFVGTYEAGTEIPENALFLSGNKFWYSTGKTTSKAFRGYFSFYMVLAEMTAAETRISLCIDNKETSDIEKVQSSAVNIGNSLYDLQGRRVESSIFNSQFSLLKKGLYVKNGKKIIIK